MDSQEITTKLCPICGETVKVTARKCIHCNEFIDRDSTKGYWPAWTGFNNRTLWEWMTVLIFPALLGTAGIWVARAQYNFEVDREIAQQETAVAGATATSRANLETVEAGLAFQATQDAQHTATRSVATAEAQSTAVAINAAADVRAAEASGNRASVQFARDNATAQADAAAAAVRATEDAINAKAAAAQRTQAAASQMTVEARATEDALVLEATLAVVELPTPKATLTLMPTSTPTFTPTVAPTVAPTATPTATPLVTPMPTPVSRTFPPADRLIFVSDRTGSSQASHLYIMDSDGSTVRQLARESDIESSYTEPNYAADVGHIVFTRNTPDGQMTLYRVEPDEQGEFSFNSLDTNNSSTDGFATNSWEPAISPDGQRIVFVSSRDGLAGELYLSERDPSDVQPLLCAGLDRAWLKNAPAWSPDNGYIAFVVATDRTLFAVPTADNSALARETGRGWADIWRLNIQTGDCLQLTNTPNAANLYPDWSPDGQRIVFVSNRDGDFVLFTMNADGGSQQPVANSPAGVTHPAWSPDGNWFAFTGSRRADEDAQGDTAIADIFVMTVAGESLTNLTNGNGDSWYPVWVGDKATE